ncbi:MAG: FG-GAP-like repeat-containing protein [Gemmatimonadaceae bacterium]
MTLPATALLALGATTVFSLAARELPRYDRTLLLESTSETSANASFGDLDGDGHLDIVLAKGRHWPLKSRVLLGDGRGGIRAAYDLGPTAEKTYSARLVDLDADGDLDVVTSNDAPSPKLVYLNDGKGRFSVGSEYGRRDWPMRNATVADMNGDGRPDIIVANRFGRSAGSNYICLNRGRGMFDADCIPFAPEPATTITAADFNGDGAKDLLVPHRNGGQGRLYFGAGGADLAKLRSVPFGPTDAQMRIAEAADFNGDGRMDVVAIDESRGVAVYEGRGDGTFAPPRPVGDRGVVPYALTTGDLNVDGRMDFVVGNVRAPSTVYFNDGDGQRFTSLNFGDDQGSAYGIDIGDFDADGRLDIAVARSDAPNALYFADGELRLTYLGNAGWEITDGKTVVLVDPFVTQFNRWNRGGPERVILPTDPYPADTALINRHIKRADYILITHGHSDHALDAGPISKKTGAVIVGTETAANLARAYDVKEDKLITVVGGEDYDFETFSLRVIPSIHSALDDKRYFNNGRGIAGTAPRGLRAPLRRNEYQEGGSVAYLIRLGGHEVLAMGSMNFLEREMQGLRPNIALVGANSQRLEIHDYTGRLMRALGHPALVIPSHADGYGNPNPPAAALKDRHAFLDEVAAASPMSRTVVPTWFEPIVVPARDPQKEAAIRRQAERKRIDPPGLAPLVPAYSVAVRDGDLVFVSGMTGVVPGSQEIITGGVAAQTRQTLENIRTSLEAAGATMADVGECTVFLTNMADYAAMNAEYVKFFPTAPPSRATVAVTALPRPAALVEIKCTARRRGGE